MSKSKDDKGNFEHVSQSWLGKIAVYIVKARWKVISASIILFIVCAVIAAGTVGQLTLSRWEVPGSESYEAGTYLKTEFAAGSPNLALLVTMKEGTVDEANNWQAGEQLTSQLAAEEAVGWVSSYWSRGGTPTLRSRDGTQALILAHLKGTATEARSALSELTPAYAGETDQFHIEVGGQDELFRQAAELARRDFIRAEMIIIPGAMLLLMLVYRRFRATLLTLSIGLFAMVGTLAGLGAVVLFTDVSTFALNLTLVMGLGLGIDYTLFMIARFREQLASGNTKEEAVVRTVETAGRTVIYSGITVGASCAVLFVFPFPFLQSFAYTGILVVLSGMIGSVLILPAFFAVLGEQLAVRSKQRTNLRPTSVATTEGRWYKLSKQVMRRPLVYAIAATIVLLILGSPIQHLQFGFPDHHVLPAHATSRIVEEQKNANFAAEETDAIQVVAPKLDTTSQLQEIAEYAAALSQLDGVMQVDSLTGSYAQGEQLIAPNQYHDRFVADDGVGTFFTVIPYGEDISVRAVEMVREIRAMEPEFQMIVGGYPADLTDFRDELLSRIPIAIVMVLVITLVILFLMTGSVLLPIKATVMNMLSLSIMFGSLVWVFQEGHLSELLQFTAAGTIEPSIPILMFCIAYGLSMDYEVFILSRMKEEYERTRNLEQSVATGIQKSASLVTSAALILAFSFAAYVSGEVVFLKMLGVGMTLAVIVDATIIRLILIPAFMKLAGKANWWAPPLLKKIYERFGFSESSADEQHRSMQIVP